MTDRVTFSYGLTVPGPEQFSSRRFDLSVETDARPGETAEEAMARARAFIMAEMDQLTPAAVAAPTGLRRAPVQDELFDPSNPVHYRIAQSVLDAAGIRSEASREYKINKLMKGKPVDDLAAIVKADQDAYRASQGGPARGGRRW